MWRLRGTVLSLVTVTAMGLSAPAQGTSPKGEADRAEVLVLGVFHMANPGHDVFNMHVDDVLSPRRQQEIAELAAVLEKFKPTKIAVEAPYGEDVVQKRYADYLAGTRPLSRNEVEQIGFRLAKELGHTAIHAVDAEGDFPFQRVIDYAKATGQSAKLDAMMGEIGETVKAQSEHLKTHTVLETLLYMNSDAKVAQDVGFYYLEARYGEPGDYAGPDLLAEWYRRNVRIYNNVTKLVATPEDRVLVIFGAGHLGWLRQDFGADTTLRLRRLEDFVPASANAVPTATATPAAPASDTYPIKRLPFLTWVVDYEPSWSPDGKQIVLISNRHGGMKVHVLAADAADHGAGMRQLTFGEAEDDSPAWSPDGKKIAYVSVREGFSEIWVMNADGSDQHSVTPPRTESIHPAWSAEGSRILVNTNAFAGKKQVTAADAAGPRRAIGDASDDAMDLATVRPDGTDFRRLTTGGGYTYASYSPDGQLIVHRRIQGAASRIWVMNADGTGDHDVSGTATADGWPAWSPDGKRIVFARQAGESFQIFVMNRDGSGVRQVTDASGRFTNPRWSPDGSTILCSRGLGSMSLVTFPAPPAPK